MAGDNDRFTAGDTLTPGTIEHAAHLAMMSNELKGGRGAYQISNAVLGASGPSYGPFQYDLGGNPRARELLEEIAKKAVDESGNRFISDRDLGAMREHLYRPFSRIQADPAAQATYDRLLPRINAALDSGVGRGLINEDYLAALAGKIESVNETIASVPNAANRQFLEGNRLAQLIVLDTANQYGPPVNDGLRKFMSMTHQSEPMPMPRRRSAELIGVSGDFGIEDMIRYKLETEYGQSDDGARDVLRRISNLVDAVGAQNIRLSEEDRQFLDSGLRRYLLENGRDPRIMDHPGLASLRNLAVDTALLRNDGGLNGSGVQHAGDGLGGVRPSSTGDVVLDRLAMALSADDHAQINRIAGEIAHSPEVQSHVQAARDLLAMEREPRQEEAARQMQDPMARL